jgi:hypothetical protein
MDASLAMPAKLTQSHTGRTDNYKIHNSIEKEIWLSIIANSDEFRTIFIDIN